MSAAMTEPADVRWMRRCLKGWRLPRGRDRLMRLFQLWLAGREFVIDVEPGIVIPAALDDWMVYWCFVGDHQRDRSFQWSLAMIRPGDTVVDAGANIGLWALSAARRVGGQGRVIAFEPVARNFERLQEHVRMNEMTQVRCESSALSNQPGPAVMYVRTAGHSGLASLVAHEGLDETTDVRRVTLDDYCAEHGIGRVDVLKVDVEGGELQVFEGAQALLGGPEAPLIMFEMDDRLAAPFGSSFGRVRAALAGWGYTVYRQAGGRLAAVGAGPAGAHEDLFALKPAHAARTGVPR